MIESFKIENDMHGVCRPVNVGKLIGGNADSGYKVCSPYMCESCKQKAYDPPAEWIYLGDGRLAETEVYWDAVIKDKFEEE